MITAVAILIGVILDFIFGDPNYSFHPIILIGKLIHKMELRMRKKVDGSSKALRRAGRNMWFVVILISGLIPALLLVVAYWIHPYVYGGLTAIFAYQIMATKCLKQESMKVYDAVMTGDIMKARYQVSMIVGRDTTNLTMTEVAKAAVETVAENTSDGSVAPLLYMALFGPVGGFIYKAVNTMDSMVGYKNEKYLDFGRFAAKADDVFNFIPSRLAGFFMVVACALCRMNPKRAWHVFLRDRKKSPSPNSAQTESVCAGALGVCLLGDTTYFGTVHHKQVIGIKTRDIEPDDIKKANRLLYVTVWLTTIVFLGIRFFITGWIG